MLVAQITDSHIEIPEPEGAGRLEDFERVIADIEKLQQKPDIVIHSGDVTHCDRLTEYRQVSEMLQKLSMPFYVIPGNKDGRANMAKVFDLPDGFIQQTIETPDWQLVLLDTLSENSNLGTYCGQRMKWLEKTLSAGNKPVAIFMHHPSFEMTDNPYPFQFEDPETAAQFDRLVTGFDNVKGIFCGHAHRNTTGNVGHIPGMTLTAMSLDRRKGTYPAEMEGKPLYQLINFLPGGRIERDFRVTGT